MWEMEEDVWRRPLLKGYQSFPQAFRDEDFRKPALQISWVKIDYVVL